MNQKSSYIDQLDRLFETYFEELQALSDENIMGDETASAVRARTLDRIQRASVEAGRRRLASARRAKEISSKIPIGGTSISATDARAYIAAAAKSAQLTLAARNLDEMTDVDALRLYSQIRELESDS